MCGQCLIFSRHFIYWAATNLAFYLPYPTTDTESGICFRVKASENAEIHILSKLRSRILFFPRCWGEIGGSTNPLRNHAIFPLNSRQVPLEMDGERRPTKVPFLLVMSLSVVGWMWP